MHPHGNYLPTDKMCDLICENHTLLQVMSRFGLPLGCGEKTVEEVCRENGVDAATFLAVINFVLDDCNELVRHPEALSVPCLMDYLRRAHHYFLDFCLPQIRRKLVEALEGSEQNDVALLILRFYDEYTAEVRRHMDYEDSHVFTYVDQLLQKMPAEGYSIHTFARRHDRIDSKLTELKNIIIKYYSASGNHYLLHSVLFDIFSCERDLSAHCKTEDLIFIPAVACIERRQS